MVYRSVRLNFAVVKMMGVEERLATLCQPPLLSVLCSNFRSSFRGETVVLGQQKSWYSIKNAKDVGKLSVRERPRQVVAVQSSNRSFEQSHRPRGTYPPLGTTSSSRRSTGSVESKFNLEQTSSSPASEGVQPQGLRGSGKPVATVVSSSEHRRSRVAEESRADLVVSGPNAHGRSDVRVETRVGQIADRAMLRSFEGGAHLVLNSQRPSNSSGKRGSGTETSLVVAFKARSSQNGAHSPLNEYRSPSTSKQSYNGHIIKQLPSGVPKVNPFNQRHLQQQIDAFREQWNKPQEQAAKWRRKRHADSRSLLGARHGNDLVRPDVPPSQAHPGAAKWREEARRIEENRRPAHDSGGIGAGSWNTDSVHFEPEPSGDFEKVHRRPEAHNVSQNHEPEDFSGQKGGLFPASSNSGGYATSVEQNLALEEFTQLGLVDESSEEAELRIQPDEEQQWMNPEVLVVNSVSTAKDVVEKLRGQYKDCIHACDTEVAEIDVKKESPVGHGRMICFSIYCGPTTDFGGGKCRLWVDVLGKPAVLDVFRSYFEDPSIKKVWHNYSFDKHILANHDIDAQGFYADTMHLARLYDSARTVVQGGYSLEGLTADKHVMGSHWGELKVEEESGGKQSMKQLFGKANIKKNGEEGKLRVVPPVEELQTQPEWRDKWIHYSSFDAVCTWCLWKSLQDKLGTKDWLIEGKFRKEGKYMYDFYVEYVQPFGELLVQMEAEGMMLDCKHLEKIEEVAIKQQEFSANRFKIWAAKYCPDAIYMNVGSDAQIRQLLFGGKENRNDPHKRLEMERVFNAPNTGNYMEEGRKTPKKTRPFTLRGLGVDIPVDSYTSAGWPAVGGAALKALAGKVSIDYTMLDETETVEDPSLGEDSAVLTSTGVKGGSEEDLSVYGKAFKAFGGGKEGKEACIALAALCEVASINTLISNFIQPLQGSDIKGPDGRIHCSLNINTETGRLSARRPSLQNQPALEKDRYKIRQAFIAAPGNSLIVADYGQLELRILAHLTDCKSMLRAFIDGGDFHSRTAMNMYPHVRDAVENGDVILEWEPKPGENKPPVPLLKDVFGAERRKAKMLNFSIAYGKTAMGLSKDWKVSLDEAKATVELWYSDRQEVRRWQQQRIKEANFTHHVHTLLGRTRHFPHVQSSSKLVRGHIERAAINTPVQGSAADVAMCAMLEINRNKILQDLGWKLLLQVHDEVILEGPSKSAALAKDVVVKCMGFPFGGRNNLKVALAVDAKYAQSWYAAK